MWYWEELRPLCHWVYCSATEGHWSCYLGYWGDAERQWHFFWGNRDDSRNYWSCYSGYLQSEMRCYKETRRVIFYNKPRFYIFYIKIETVILFYTIWIQFFRYFFLSEMTFQWNLALFCHLLDQRPLVIFPAKVRLWIER